ncbi:MAG: Rne/Rng family ribonuclease [Alcaligenaceae bacterium]|nr:Rne/Rng family ribonuclease [Alcaligenaceae bacterium]
MKRILFNATHQEELRVAIVDRNKLIDFDIHVDGKEQRKQNIYKAKVTRIEPSLEACFVDYGYDRQGFLPFKQIHRSYFKEGADYRTAKINEVIEIGQELLVQVEKEERGAKGASLTTFISLAGRFLVLMPNNPRAGGVSRRIDGEERQELRQAMQELNIPNTMGAIARTAAIGRSAEELNWDLSYLLKLWDTIQKAATQHPSPVFIYQEENIVFRTIRDHFSDKIQEIIVDTDEIYEQVKSFLEEMMPDKLPLLKRYADNIPLFSRFQIEEQIQSAYGRTVTLPSGGAIVIDHTEALVAVDVNSARATRGTDIEETALKTNLEAAEEVARQMRLRDLGGLIVVDFIDMEENRHQKMVEHALKEAVSPDRARIQLGKISKFGLMELSRQRLRPALAEGTHTPCQQCNGTGSIRDNESTALSILRILQQESLKEEVEMIHVQVPVEIATFLINEKREDIVNIEQRTKVHIIIIPNPHYVTSQYKLESIKEAPEQLERSASLSDKPETDLSYQKQKKAQAKQQPEKKKPVIRSVSRSTPPPQRQARSIFSKVGQLLGSLVPKKNKQKTTQKNTRSQAKRTPQHKKGARKRTNIVPTKKGLKQQNNKPKKEANELKTPAAAQKRNVIQKRGNKDKQRHINKQTTQQNHPQKSKEVSSHKSTESSQPIEKKEATSHSSEVQNKAPLAEQQAPSNQHKKETNERDRNHRRDRRKSNRRTSSEQAVFVSNEELLAQQEAKKAKEKLKQNTESKEQIAQPQPAKMTSKKETETQTTDEIKQEITVALEKTQKSTATENKPVQTAEQAKDTKAPKQSAKNTQSTSSENDLTFTQSASESILRQHTLKSRFGISPNPIQDGLMNAFFNENPSQSVPNILANNTPPHTKQCTTDKVVVQERPIKTSEQTISKDQVTIHETTDVTASDTPDVRKTAEPQPVVVEANNTSPSEEKQTKPMSEQDTSTQTSEVIIPEVIKDQHGETLICVQTKSELVKPYTAPTVPLGRPRPQQTTVEHGPLVQVETQK